MMDELIFKHLKAIGDIKLEISNAGTMDVALEKCLKIVAAVCRTDTAVLWYYDSTGDHKLHPQYWMGSENVMKITYEPGEGIVGQVFKTGKSVNIFDYKSHADIKDKAFSDMQIKSMICVPLENQYETLGCLQFIKKECEDKPFDEEDASVCEILSMLAATAIDDNNLLFDKWTERKAIVTLNNVTKEFRNGDIITKVLKGLNLEVYEGEMLVILGESGCGKSTALNIIGGMDRMTSGTFTFMGKDYSNADEKVLTEYRRSSLGFVFQSYNLMPNLTARQNIKFIAELSKNSHDPDKVLDMVGLTSRKNNYPSQMSGGQQQRVSIARAIVKNPKIILADEPTAALDYATSIEVLTVMENIISTGTTIVMVTHNEEITRMANRVIRMRNGVAAEIIMNRHPVKASELVW